MPVLMLAARACKTSLHLFCLGLCRFHVQRIPRKSTNHGVVTGADADQQAALHTGMNGVHGLAGWRWLFIFDGVITLPMALWGEHLPAKTASRMLTSTGYYALPDLPSTTRVRWLKPEEKELALERMRKAGKHLEEPFTMQGLERILRKWHFWVYTAYYTSVPVLLMLVMHLQWAASSFAARTSEGT